MPTFSRPEATLGGGHHGRHAPGEAEQLPQDILSQSWCLRWPRRGLLGPQPPEANRGWCWARLGRCPQAGSAGPDKAAKDTGRIVWGGMQPSRGPRAGCTPTKPHLRSLGPEAVLKMRRARPRRGGSRGRQCPSPAHVSRAWKTADDRSSWVVTTRTLRNLSTSASSWERRVFSLYMISRWWRPRK